MKPMPDTKGTRDRLRLGVNLPTQVEPGYDPIAFARDVEQLGFDFVSSSDHPAAGRPNYETWTTLACVAAATTRIHVATRVLGLPYRAPSMVAKMAETLSRLSDGRVILGLGGGYGDDEHRSFGVPVRSDKEKITALEDALQVIRGLWSESPFSYRGTYYEVSAAELEPKPAGQIPIWLGTFGPRSLALTGRLADGWIPTLGHASAEDLPKMRRRVTDAAEAAGKDPLDLEYILNLTIDVSGAPVEESSVGGSSAEIIETLGRFVEQGFSGFNFIVGDDRAEQLAHLASEIVPALRASA
jgi:alkanesulfonate monooxygenase SsuD/methylene tetrahydromethanopterin reductase-like flavin-dependent oxidoreductase (luciferase family)